MKKLYLKGSCLCEGVKFETHGFHRDVHNCHCIQCSKTHGNYAAYTSVQKSNINFLKNNTLKWYKSSKRAKRGFCKKCGASLFFKVVKIFPIYVFGLFLSFIIIDNKTLITLI